MRNKTIKTQAHFSVSLLRTFGYRVERYSNYYSSIKNCDCAYYIFTYKLNIGIIFQKVNITIFTLDELFILFIYLFNFNGQNALLQSVHAYILNIYIYMHNDTQ